MALGTGPSLANAGLTMLAAASRAAADFKLKFIFMRFLSFSGRSIVDLCFRPPAMELRGSGAGKSTGNGRGADGKPVNCKESALQGQDLGVNGRSKNMKYG